MMRRCSGILAVLSASLLVLATPAIAQSVEEGQKPVLMEADELNFDEDLGTATARGNVEIVQGERVLNADAVTYNQRDDIVTASGNVVVLEPTGEVLFAEFAELTGDLREGFLRGFKMLLTDDTRLAAVSAQRRGGVETELTRAAYSPCITCTDDDGEPVWQVKARRIIHNADDREVVYRDASLEFLGFPVAYTPYLRHPDPTVERKSGFLTPTFGVSSLLGSSMQAPYFWAIDRERDFTFDPIFFTDTFDTIFSTDNLPVITGKYRQRFADGEHFLRLSATSDSVQDGTNRLRGHIDSETRFSINDSWRSGLDVKLASDDTYLRRYGFPYTDTLRNHLFVEGFGSRSYAIAEGYYFQGLRRNDEQSGTPLVAPKLNYNYVSEPNSFGGMTTLDTEVRAMTREEGASSQKFSLIPGWQISHTDSLGSITSFRTSLQADLYNTKNVKTARGSESGVDGRLFPQAIISWRYPWVRRSGRTSQIVEPLMALVLAPNGGNPDEIPNEDSQSVEFDETNLFRANRFTGTDRVEGGQRAVYGLRTGFFGDGGGSTTLIVGQSFRFRDDSPFKTGSGLEDQLSDIVASLQVSPNKYFDLLYKTRFEKDSLRAHRTEIGGYAGPPALRLNLNYAFFDKAEEFADREEVTVALTSQLTERWTARVHTRRDLTSEGGALYYGAALRYDCDCSDFELTYLRLFTRDRDVPPTESLIFRVTLKSLGQVSSSVF
jgi:LPS-assembly protein